MSDTLVKMVLRLADHYGQRTVLREKVNGAYTDISWAEMAKSIALYGQSMLALGIKKDDRVAIMAPNCPAWVCSLCAIL